MNNYDIVFEKLAEATVDEELVETLVKHEASVPRSLAVRSRSWPRSPASCLPNSTTIQYALFSFTERP